MNTPRYLFDPGEQLSPRSKTSIARMNRERSERFNRRMFWALLVAGAAAIRWALTF